jgi:eukaryotic-like serine/threonine-protein kinase
VRQHEENTWSEQSGDVPPARTSFDAGVVLQGTYRILRPIASGGMGEVYVAAHERLPGAFAVKVLHRDFTRDEDALSRFRCEAEIMAGLRHPNIVQVFDFNITADGTPYLVMELVEGKDLSEYLRGGKPLPPFQVTRIIHQIASALEAAHAHGVVHRDLKPENVMLSSMEGQEDFIKVVDFGISKARWSNRITADSAILGTPQFMAPEQAQGRREEIDHRTDQFAVASMTYTLLTGREPFRGDTAVTILYQVVHQDADPLSSYVSWPCENVDAVLRRGMAKNREARFPSVLEFARALDDAITADLGPELRPRSLTPRSVAPLAPAYSGQDTVRETPQVSSELKTVRLRTKRCTKPRMAAAGLLGAAAVAAVVLYLDTLGWDNLGSAFGVAYRNAVDATARTVSRFRAPIEVPAAPDAPALRHGTEMLPLPSTLPIEVPAGVGRLPAVGSAP